MRRIGWAGGWALVALVAGVIPAGAGVGPVGEHGKKAHSIYDFRVKTITGEDRSLAEYRGKALLVVNTASRCGFTPQYKSLEAVYQKYRTRGFEVLAFPANNFKSQEPGSNEEIQKFCTTNYQTTFPLFSKISVKGDDIAPLYTWLTKQSGFPGDIEWNFTKFLVGPDGRVVARFPSRTDPLTQEVTDEIEATLPHK